MTPYVGLRPFARADHAFFFGREREITDVASLWLSNRLLVVYGQSGVGKSSLLNAGVIPLLETRPVEVLPPARPRDVLTTWLPYAQPDSMSLTEFFRRRQGLTDDFGDPQPLLAAIDQFEEIYIAFRPQARERLLDDLAAALTATPQLRLLLAMREDFYAAFLSQQERLASRSRQQVRLVPLTVPAAVEAVREPARLAGRGFADGAAEYLVDNIRTANVAGFAGSLTHGLDEHVEPVQLQVVCQAMWNKLPDDLAVITLDDVEAHADVDRTLADFYNEGITRVSARWAVTESELRGWVEEHFITELGTRGLIYQGLSHTGGMPNEVALDLENLHLLKVERRADGTRWFELQHDRLIGPIQQANREWRTGSVGVLPRADGDLLAAAEALALGELEDAAARAHEVIGSPAPMAAKAEAEVLLARTEAARGRLDRAEVRFRRAIEAFSELGEEESVYRVLARLGATQLEAGRYTDAVVNLEQAAERLPEPDTNVLLAIALWRAGQRVAARAVFARTLRETPDSTGAAAGLGELLAELGEAGQALAYLDRALTRHDDPAGQLDLHSARALALAALGQTDEAKEVITRVLRLNQDRGVSLLRAAKIYLLAGEAGTARQFAERALTADRPPLPEYLRGEAGRLF
ncbi:tetratricopeptide repeat protein [Nonomuraea sp. NBC_01738]|uniref:nSTAND1 domain-containing NTPase n=1 Tax=Nonomuraea sp. NBC_01738 TaxID=2976003 RepID=UPI002E1224E3|nr:tetratricopeptide repeat protein [Nonomuraea sp. NBC_01738]